MVDQPYAVGDRDECVSGAEYGQQWALQRVQCRQGVVVEDPPDEIESLDAVVLGAVPGGGTTAWLPRLMGRGWALEVLLGADDFRGDLAERYGYVNRALPDAELDEFVDRFANRLDVETSGSPPPAGPSRR